MIIVRPATLPSLFYLIFIDSAPVGCYNVIN